MAQGDTSSTKMDETPNFNLKFAHSGATIPEEKQELLEARNKKNTNHATKSNLKVQADCLGEKQLKTFEEFHDDELPDMLDTFYSDLRRKDGELYKLQSLKCIRAGINRYTKEHRNIDITADPSFSIANECFKACAVR